jgi:AraC family transcriptional regulator
MDSRRLVSRSGTRADAALPPVCDAPIRRTRLWDGGAALVEDLQCGDQGELRSFSPKFQVCFPYRGLFLWHVGNDDVVADANQVLFVSGGEGYRVTQPGRREYAELIITPDPEVLCDIAGVAERGLASHPLFLRRSRRADLELLSARARLLNLARCGEPVATDENVIGLLGRAMARTTPTRYPSSSSRRLVRRAKEYVQEHASTPLRLREIAAAVGSSAPYLTDLFRQIEGIPLHRYITQLRLARSLVALPHATDLTTLAFDLGFSSHSHFTAAFRKAFGCTPSQFRTSARTRQPQYAIDGGR